MEEHYAQSIKILHWVMGAAMLTCMGTVKLSQWTTADTWWNGYVSTKGTKGATKGALMMIHKSTAVLVAAMIVPRVLLRMVTKAPTPLEGPALEHFAANVSHTALCQVSTKLCEQRTQNKTCIGRKHFRARIQERYVSKLAHEPHH